MEHLLVKGGTKPIDTARVYTMQSNPLKSDDFSSMIAFEYAMVRAVLKDVCRQSVRPLWLFAQQSMECCMHIDIGRDIPKEGQVRVVHDGKVGAETIYSETRVHVGGKAIDNSGGRKRGWVVESTVFDFSLRESLLISVMTTRPCRAMFFFQPATCHPDGNWRQLCVIDRRLSNDTCAFVSKRMEGIEGHVRILMYLDFDLGGGEWEQILPTMPYVIVFYSTAPGQVNFKKLGREQVWKDYNLKSVTPTFRDGDEQEFSNAPFRKMFDQTSTIMVQKGDFTDTDPEHDSSGEYYGWSND